MDPLRRASWTRSRKISTGRERKARIGLCARGMRGATESDVGDACVNSYLEIESQLGKNSMLTTSPPLISSRGPQRKRLFILMNS